jgi:hypothetical protein
MKRHVYIVASCTWAVLLAAGCSRTETPAATTTAPPPAQPAQEAPSTASTPAPPPPMPPPNAPAGEASSGPKPGQVNDHSNPEFKKGGKEDPAK